jgi:hypothetical protein
MQRMLVGAGAAALALVTGGCTTQHAAAPSSSTARTAASTWRVTQTTKLPGDDILSDLTVAPTGSAWAVGFQHVSGRQRPVVQHLSGGTWKDVTLPATWTMPLTVVDASSSKNVWAFGDSGEIVRWNGKKWTTSKFAGAFRAIDAEAISASNVWAVDGTTARHWNGSTWVSVKPPIHASAVHAVSAKNIWVAGSIRGKAAVAHWNGSSWKLVKTVQVLPVPDDDAGTWFRDITVSGKNVWAVGSQVWSCGEDDDDTCYRPVALRLTGKKSKSFIGPQSLGYTKVAADGSGGVWIMQDAWNAKFVHVRGDSFTSSAAPRPADHDINLAGLENRAGTKTVWSVGASFPEGDPPDPTGDGLYLRIG